MKNIDITKKQAFNPFLPDYEYIPDGEPYVFGDRVYIYGSHDAFNGKNYCVNNYVCWSAPVEDLGNWKYEGVIFDKMQDPYVQEHRLDTDLYAPDLQQGRDGRFYLYYFYNLRSAIGVAVCDEPAGKFEFYGYVHYADGTVLGEKEGDTFQFDPGVLVDDDTVYLYTGFCPPDQFPWEKIGMPNQKSIGAVALELEQDMITIKTPARRIVPYVGNSAGTGFEGHEFFEASSMRKIGGTYYFIYSSIQGHELCYATSKYPDRDFVFGGTIVSNGDIFSDKKKERSIKSYVGNNHGSIVQIKGQWYVFYHRHTNRIQFSRQACAERIYFDENGSIPQVEMTSCGLNNGPLAGNGKYEARIACNLWSRDGACGYGLGDRPIGPVHPFLTQEGEDRESHSDEDGHCGQYIANMNDGSVAGFKYFDIKEVDAIAVIVRRMQNVVQEKEDAPKSEENRLSREERAVLRVYRDLDSVPVAEIPLKDSTGWIECESKADIPAGVTALYFQYAGEGSYDFLSFELKSL